MTSTCELPSVAGNVAPGEGRGCRRSLVVRKRNLRAAWMGPESEELGGGGEGE